MPEDYKKEMDGLLEEVIKRDATDLHISAGRPPIFRVDGGLVVMEGKDPISPDHAKGLALSLLNKAQEEKFLADKDVDLSIAYQDKARFRVNIYQESNNIAAAMRFIPSRIRTIEELSLPPILHQFTQASQGFFLVVGPSGHGKSTALAAMVDEINHSRTDHMITIEDPIEYIFPQDKCIIDQREVSVDVADFHRGLRAMFRQDADVAMIGEMRDPETISTAMTAAETGHLIFSTLHTNTAAQTIDRIIDSFPPHQQGQIRMQLSATLLGVLSRRLVPAAKGGLINAVELLIANSAVRNLIREGKTHQIDMVIETSVEEGMISLNRSLADLVNQGLVSFENAEMFSNNPHELKMILQR
ncbi:MAG: PilT/PilU family type 4a pilus ATPase [Candidatus Portnoybacteria bacterium]|nr:PilT/PilU family type 4a pilus ATPase [Candidatus Portnoybacteria bacterium]MDD4982888.1 PilT/PilU family type 4a pilus ATPase [Candidatus Portnoybacteria bacterium]